MKKLACIALIAGMLPILSSRAQTNFTPGRYWCDTQDVTKAASQHKFNQWYQAESLRKEIVSRVVSNALDMSATNLMPVWEVVSTTNIATSYIICTGTVYDATNGAVRYDVTPAGANLAPGNYRGYSRLLQSVGGTNINIAVLQYQDIQVLESPDSENYGMVGPITPTSYVQNVIDGGTSGSVGVVTRSGGDVTIVFPEPLAGSGDMLKSVYDVNTNGVVDNAEALGGTAAAAYATDVEVASAVATKADSSTVYSAMSAKADSNIVYTAIAAKADSSTVYSAISAKADSSTVYSAISTRADSNIVYTAIAGKADSNAVYSAIATKADSSTVYSAVSAKADSNIVYTAIAAKADSNTLYAIIPVASNAAALASWGGTNLITLAFGAGNTATIMRADTLLKRPFRADLTSTPASITFEGSWPTNEIADAFVSIQKGTNSLTLVGATIIDSGRASSTNIFPSSTNRTGVLFHKELGESKFYSIQMVP